MIGLSDNGLAALFIVFAAAGHNPQAEVGPAATRPSLDEAIYMSAERWGIPYQGLKAIQLNETGPAAAKGLSKPVVSLPNTNGTVDLGVMQINGSWLPKLKKYGVTAASLQTHETNAHLSGWFLKNYMVLRSTDVWDAMGWYNAIGPEQRKRYIDRAHANAVTVRTQPVVRAGARVGYKSAVSSLSLPEPGSQEAREFFDTSRRPSAGAAAPFEDGLTYAALAEAQSMAPIHTSRKLRILSKELGEDDPKLRPPAKRASAKTGGR